MFLIRYFFLSARASLLQVITMSNLTNVNADEVYLQELSDHIQIYVTLGITFFDKLTDILNYFLAVFSLVSAVSFSI